MTERPTAVTVIGWFWRVGGIVAMVFSLPLALRGQDWFGQYWANAILRFSPLVLFLWAFFSGRMMGRLEISFR